MWYIFDTNFTLQSVLDNIINLSIEHHFYEAGTITVSVPYEKETFDVLKQGNILWRMGDKEAFRIHTVEVSEEDKTILAFGLDLRSILNQRVIDKPKSFTTNASNIMNNLVNTYIINPADTKRKIPNILKTSDLTGLSALDVSYYTENVYSVISELSKSNGVGFRFNYFPMPSVYNGISYDKKILFETFLGTDRTINQNVVPPVRWSSNWGNTRSELYTISAKDYKNVCFTVSGDETSPIVYVSDTEQKTGWDRFEMMSVAGDVTKTTQDENGVTLTTAQITNLLKSRGGLELYRNFLLNDYQFTLSEDIPEIYGIDFKEGDLVSVVHEGLGIVKHSRITTVIETVENGVSKFEIKFDE